MDLPAAPAPSRDLGVMLREWRNARRLSQAALAADAGLSSRHMSYIETGKAKPSREAVLRIAEALAIPLRERNALLVAAGYAPIYRETGLDQPELDQVRQAIDFILAQQEPYPAFVVNRRWDVLSANAAADRVNRFILGGRLPRHRNIIRQFFDPEDLRPAVANWEEIAGALLQHLHQLVATAPGDLAARALLEDVLRYPGVPAHWHRRDPAMPRATLMTTVLGRGERQLSFFSTISTFGTPWDITLDEIHIECCFPADVQTRALCAELAVRGVAD